MSTLEDLTTAAAAGRNEHQLIAGEPIPLPSGRALYTDNVIIGGTGSGGSSLAAAIAARVLACDAAPRLVVITPSSARSGTGNWDAWLQAFPQGQIAPLLIDDWTPSTGGGEGCQRALTLVHSVALEAERHLLMNQRRTLLVLDDAFHLVRRMALPFPLERTITTITQVQAVDDLLASTFGRLLLESATTFWIGNLGEASTEVPGLGRLPRHRQQHTGEDARDFLLIHPRAGLIRSVLVRREDVPAAFIHAAPLDRRNPNPTNSPATADGSPDEPLHAER